MNQIARALFGDLVDYAGLFPPAGLPMDQAYSRYLDHRRSDVAWILSRFVCPATRLEDLEAVFLPPDDAQPLALAILGRGGRSLEQWLGHVDQDVKSIRAFQSRHGEYFDANVFEVRLPEEGGAVVAVEGASRVFTQDGSTPGTVFFEVSLLDDWRLRLPAVAAAVRDTDRVTEGQKRVGLKIRCGGTDASTVPEAEAVAAAIATCRATGISMKATQGLHHPFRHHDPGLSAMAHGFINLFTASILAHTHDLPVRRLAEIVNDTDPNSFSLDAENLRWHEFEASIGQIAAAREKILTSFGSCSLAEPVGDLRRHGLI